MSIDRHILDLRDRMVRLEQIRAMRNAEIPDGLSGSLWEFCYELSALNDDEIAALADELEISIDDVRELAASLSR